MRVTALMWARNDETTVGAAVRELLTPEVIDVVVVDDCSSDRTAEVAREAGADVVRLPARMGRGSALNHGLRELDSRPDYDVLLVMDADSGVSANDAWLLFLPILDGAADMTIGVTPDMRSGLRAGRVEDLARRGLKRRTGLEFAAPLSGVRAIHPCVLRAGTYVTAFGGVRNYSGIEFAPHLGLEVALTLDVVQAGFRVMEVPLETSHVVKIDTAAGLVRRGRQWLDVRRALSE